MIEILTWTALIAGGLLILLLLLSLIGGFDLDLDVGATEVEADAGGLGLVKGLLSFVAVGAYVMKIALSRDWHPGVAIGMGLFAGLIAFLMLSYFVKLLMKNEENVNWSLTDSLYQKGQVYLKIPAQEGSGIVQVQVKGASRELKAKSIHNTEIPTGATVLVVDLEGEFVLVEAES